MKTKVLIIGFGNIAQRHYKNLKKILPQSEFSVLSKSRKIFNKKLRFLNNLEEAKIFRPNVTIICSPANTHIQYAKIFSEINSNIFIEKPVAINSNFCDVENVYSPGDITPEVQGPFALRNWALLRASKLASSSGKDGGGGRGWPGCSW